MSKTINTRIGLKYDSWSNWFAKGTWSDGVFAPDPSAQTTYASGFTPLRGEVVFFAVPGSAGAVANEPAILFKVGDGNTTLEQLPWGSAIAADVYGWAKNQSLLGGTESGGTWTWSSDPAYAYEQAEVAAFVHKETATLKMKVDQVTVENFESIYGRPYDQSIDANKIGKYQISVSTDNGSTWTPSGEPFAITIEDYTAGSGLNLNNNQFSVKTKNGGYIENTDDGQGNDTGIDVVASTVSYTPASDAAPASLSATTGVLVNQSVAQIKSYIDAKVAESTSAGAVSVVKQGTAEEGYAHTYYVTQNGAQVGAKINIPKDFLVKSATLDTVTDADKAAGGKFENDPNFEVGDKYIDFVINAIDASATAQHIYLNVKDLVDAYEGAPTQYITVAIDNTNHISATALTANLEDSHNLRYEFTSYNADIGGTQYGTGVAELVGQDTTTTTVKVISNSPYTEWVGRVFTVNAIELESGHRYQLHENGTAIDVWVEVNGEIPSVNGLATSLNVKNYVDNAVGQATPNIEAGNGIDITTSGSTKTVSVKLDDTHNASGISGNTGSGLVNTAAGLAIDDSLTWVLQCGGAE